MSKISIIVPVYNDKEEYFEKCINSIINQTLKDIEIIIVDDGSINGISKNCRRFADNDDRIVFIQQRNQGVSVARNNAIKIATGEYIMFVDSDDWLEVNACERLYQYTKNNMDVVIGRNYSYYDEKKEEVEANFEGSKVNEIIDKSDIYKMLLIDSSKNKYAYMATPWAKLYKMELLKNKSILFNKNLKIGEDMLFNLDTIVLGNKIIVVDELIYHYRIHKNSTGYRLADKFEENCINTYKYLEERNQKYDLKLANEIYYYKIRLLDNILKFGKKVKESSREIKKIVNEPIYNEAIKKINIKMLRMRRKILVIFARIKFYYGIKLLYKVKR